MFYEKIQIYNMSVQFEDIDLGGGVHNPNYMKYFERARNYHFKSIGISTVELFKNYMAFVLSESYIKFKKPLVLEQNIKVVSKISAIKKMGFKTEQLILQEDLDINNFNFEELTKMAFTICTSKFVCVDLIRKRPTPIPPNYLMIILDNQNMDTVNNNIDIISGI